MKPQPLCAFRVPARLCVAVLVAVVGGYAAIAAQPKQAFTQTSAVPPKGGDDRNGAYDAVAGWWKPAPDHDARVEQRRTA